MTLLAPVSWGELIDKITILEIKSARIADPAKFVNVKRELNALTRARDGQGKPLAGLDELARELRRVNEALWQIEDDIRECEAKRDFGAKFVELARAVYRTNDKRAELKRRVNELMGSELIEEKSYKG